MRLHDPDAVRHDRPTYPWRMAPPGLATRRQLRAAGRRPGGAPPAAYLAWYRRGRELVAPLWELATAPPVRPMTPARRRAVAAMNEARRTCQRCGAVETYVLRRSWGWCEGCITGWETAA